MGIKKILNSLLLSGAQGIFYAVVKCSECGEEVRVRISRSVDFQVEYDTTNPEHCYTVKKEIVGKKCFSLMSLTLALDKNSKVLFSNTKTCNFIDFYPEHKHGAK